MKFEKKEYPPLYVVKEIKDVDLQIIRAEAKLRRFQTIEGSAKFQVIVFKSNSTVIYAAEQLCVCQDCQLEYGSCKLFQKFYIEVQQLKETTLRSSLPSNDDVAEVDKEFVLPGSVCAIAASEKSSDTVWFVRIESEEETLQEATTDDYGHTIIPGQKFFKGRYLEKVSTKKNTQIFKEMRKLTFIYKASIVYPFVNHHREEKFYTITNNELCEIIAYAEHYGLSTP